jgi:hypothetical protein
MDRGLLTTVVGIQVVDVDDGGLAVVLTALRGAPIAFEMTLQTIPLIRSELDRIERLLQENGEG